MSQLITVSEYVTPVPTDLLRQGGFLPGDQAVAEPTSEGVLIRPLTADEALRGSADSRHPRAAWLPPVAGRVEPLAA